MFLYETGTENALPALKEAEEDPEFEVKLQIRMAIARIAEGEDAKGSVWKQMTEARISTRVIIFRLTNHHFFKKQSKR